jgi:hypothetical protein
MLNQCSIVGKTVARVDLNSFDSGRAGTAHRSRYDLQAEAPPEGAISKYRWMEEQAKLPKPENAPKPPMHWRGTCPACGDWDCERHNP